MNEADRIRDLIANAEISEALTEFSKLVEGTSKQNELILLQGRWNRLLRDIRVDVITQNAASIERNRITNSLLYVLEDWEKKNKRTVVRPQNPSITPESNNDSFPPDDQPIKKNKPLKAFISYSKANADALDRLKVFLAPLRRHDKLTSWDDQVLIPGEEWDERIMHELKTADIILLLVSPDFLATDYVMNKEINIALNRHHNKQAVIIPIILDHCQWQAEDFAKLAALPPKAKPVVDYDNPNEAWNLIAAGITDVVNQLIGA